MLADKWDMSADGTAWTFTLRKGREVPRCGSDFNGEAVCKNFDRWYNYSGLYQNVAEYWLDTFGGFAKNEDPATPASNYAGCSSTDPTTVVIKGEAADEPAARSLHAVVFLRSRARRLSRRMPQMPWAGMRRT